MVVLYIIIALVLIVFVLSSIAPKDFESSRSIEINRPQSDVYNYLKYLKNQDEWAKWNSIDPGMEKKYTGEDGEIGFESYWNSDHKKVGEGKQTIMALHPEEKVETKLEFIKPFKSIADAYMICNSIDESTTEVSWGFSSSMKAPMNIMMLFMNMDKQIGADFEEGLSNLKKILED